MSELSLQELEKTASNYHELMVPALFVERAKQVVDEANIKPGDRVLDVACGTGVLTRIAAERTGKEELVAGLDVNPGMLAVAENLSPGIDWREGAAEELPWDDLSFDVVVSQFGLMFFEDKPRALREMNRVLKPGGRLVVAVFDSLENNPGYKAMVEILRDIAGEDVAQALRFPFSLGDIEELKSLCKKSGLDSAEIMPHNNNVRFPDARTMVLADVKGWFPLAGITLDDQEIDEAADRLTSTLSEFILDDGSVEFPMPAHFILVTKT